MRHVTPNPNSLRAQAREKNHQRQALAQAYPQVGATIHQALVDLGGSNPAGGVKTILETLVEVAAPPEQMHDLFALGLRRLEQQQELHTIPNPTGYLIGIMRNVVVEAMVRGWNVAHMRAEDAKKHAQALRSRGYAEPEAQASAAPGAPSATTETTRDEEPFTPDTTLAPESGDAEKQAQEDPFEAAQRAAREEAERYAHTLPDPQARQIWQSALERIRPNVSSSAFTTWFSGTKGLVFEDERLVVRVGSSFGREHLANRFHDVIERALSEQLGEPAEARFVIIPEVQEDEA